MLFARQLSGTVSKLHCVDGYEVGSYLSKDSGITKYTKEVSHLEPLQTGVLYEQYVTFLRHTRKRQNCYTNIALVVRRYVRICTSIVRTYPCRQISMYYHAKQFSICINAHAHRADHQTCELIYNYTHVDQTRIRTLRTIAIPYQVS